MCLFGGADLAFGRIEILAGLIMTQPGRSEFGLSFG
jgi:hypothetical protein